MALALGWAGVIPFAALAAASLLDLALPPPVEPRTALVGYGAIILSFMGGVQWGLATAPGNGGNGSLGVRFGVSVLPALWGWFCLLLLPPSGALLALAAGFAALLAYDLSAVRAGFAPLWYRHLRLPLTAAVVILLTAGAF